ncbi:MAG: TIGR00341 family protein [Myxococcota bacterium]
MALRKIEAHVPADLAEQARAIVEELAEDCWVEEGGRFGTIVCGVLGAQRTGAALDLLHKKLSDQGGLLVLVQPLDGVLPRPLASDQRDARAAARSAAAVSREEVYASIADTARLDRGYLALVVLAAIVAGIGLSQDNTAAVIGAMVVAPLLGPNMALALGIVLGDGPLVRRALRTNGVGFLVALGSAALLGLALDADPSTPELVSRTRVGVWDLVLALAAGCAGALSYTTGAPTFLTGVMVAVALLPPAVASGILLAKAELDGALSALLLAGGNVTALTLAAMLTLLWRGLRPRNWWQEDAARRSARLGVSVFVLLLVMLGILIVVSQRS